MAKAFASQADLEAKQITFTQLSENAYAYTAEGDPNSGVIIGDDGVMIIDTTATPAMAQDLIAKIRAITDKPIKYVVLSHYHAVRVLGASAYFAEGAQQIIASRGTYEMIVERGEADMKSRSSASAPVRRRGNRAGPDLADARVRTRNHAVPGQARSPHRPSGRGPPRATPWSGCRSRRCCSRAIWSNTTPPAIAAMPSSSNGPPRSTRWPRCNPRSWCRAAAPR
jgi:hypothetical protein